MSRYVTLARSWWEQARPGELSSMNDPATFFSTLARQIETRIVDLSADLAGPDLAGETYLEKVGRLNAARAQAQEMALDELVYSIGPEEEPEEEISPIGQAVLEAHRLVSEGLAEE